MRADPLKNRSRDGIVSTFRQPPAALIPASKMKAKCNTGEGSHHGVVHFESLA